MNTDFQKELEHLINRFCLENESDTPDFILAEYIMGCLTAYETAVNKRGKWYVHKTLTKDFCESVEDIIPPIEPSFHAIKTKIDGIPYWQMTSSESSQST